MNIPVTNSIKARPVWLRHRRRNFANVNPFPSPTEAEKQDAIRVLEDPNNEFVSGLWDEAHRILDEAGQ